MAIFEEIKIIMTIYTETTTNEWLTPPYIIDALGKFDLDPCSPVDRIWNTATKHLTINDDGLNQIWRGRVWLNPPYGKETPLWLERLAEHKNGIALTYARTATKWFHSIVFCEADSVMFFRGWIRFYQPDGTRAKGTVSPSCLISYNEENTQAIKNALSLYKLRGTLIYLGENNGETAFCTTR